MACAALFLGAVAMDSVHLNACGCVHSYLFMLLRSQLLLVSNFLDKMLCIIGTLAGVTFMLARALKWFVAPTLSTLFPQVPVKKSGDE